MEIGEITKIEVIEFLLEQERIYLQLFENKTLIEKLGADPELLGAADLRIKSTKVQIAKYEEILKQELSNESFGEIIPTNTIPGSYNPGL